MYGPIVHVQKLTRNTLSNMLNIKQKSIQCYNKKLLLIVTVNYHEYTEVKVSQLQQIPHIQIVRKEEEF